MLYISIDGKIKGLGIWSRPQNSIWYLSLHSIGQRFADAVRAHNYHKEKISLLVNWRSQVTSPLPWLMPWLGCNSYSLFPIPLKTLFVPACEGRSPYDDRLVVITYATPITTNWGRVKEEPSMQKHLSQYGSPFLKSTLFIWALPK